MAKNLQAKLSPSDKVAVFDINRGAMEKLAKETQAGQSGGAVVELAKSAFDASQEAVCHIAHSGISAACPCPRSSPHTQMSHCDETLQSYHMI